MMNGPDPASPESPSGDSRVLEFWFDYNSPYAWFALDGFERMAARVRRRVLWRPYLLGVAARELGSTILSATPAKWDYAMRDWHRLGVAAAEPFRMPEAFPMASSIPARMTYWALSHSPLGERLPRALLAAAFAGGLDVGDPQVAIGVGVRVGLDPGQLAASFYDVDARAELRTRTGEAARGGIFGSPFIIVDGEPFWGGDRLSEAERWAVREGP